MKKILAVLLLVFFCMPASAIGQTRVSDDLDYAVVQKKIMEVGFKLLNSSRIENRVTFFYQYKNPLINAVAISRGKTVHIYKGILPFFEYEDELASVLAHEIGHQVDFYEGYWHTVSMSPFKYLSRDYEYKADKMGVDLMVNAGYNPLGMIVFMNKAMSQGSAISEFFSTHPLTSKRMMSVYEYIYSKYPEFLTKNAYKDNIYYQNFLLTSKENRLQLENKLKNPQSGVVEVRYK